MEVEKYGNDPNVLFYCFYYYHALVMTKRAREAKNFVLLLSFLYTFVYYYYYHCYYYSMHRWARPQPQDPSSLIAELFSLFMFA